MERMPPARIEYLRGQMKKYVNGKIGLKFIRAVIYPEVYAARIPYNITNIGTSIVSHRQDIVLNTGPAGEGMIFFFPRVTTGPSMFVYTSPGQ
jgi:hypothetical protein